MRFEFVRRPPIVKEQGYGDLVMGAAVAVLFSFASPALAATLHVLDIGYGSAVHLQTETGDFLFDTGPSEAAGRVMRHLADLGVRDIDAVFLSHTHPDHVGGLLPLSGKLPVHKVYWNGVAGKQDKVLADLKRLRSLTTFVLFRGSDTVRLGEDLTVTSVDTSVPGSDQNGSSLVVFVNHRRWSLLFPGDAGLERQQELVSRAERLGRVRWMMWPHHGDRLDPAFVERMPNLRYAAVSVGENPYRLPAVSLKSFSRQHGVAVFRTDVAGTLHFQLNRTIRPLNSRSITSAPSSSR